MYGRLFVVSVSVCVLGMVLAAYLYLTASSSDAMENIAPGITAFTAEFAFTLFAVGIVVIVYGWLRNWRGL